MIRANCRNRFTENDFNYIAGLLAQDKKNRIALTELLTDSECRDEILDSRSLFQTIIEKSGLSRISPFLYFYILTRHVFLENDIDDRDMTDYVACILAEFCCVKRARNISNARSDNYQYLVDMMSAFVDASPIDAFMIRSHLGNYALFMTGIFPDAVYRKATYGRRAPGFEYYESMGRSSYKWASQHKLAFQYSLVEILNNLAERFRAVRIALNDLTDNYMAMDLRAPDMDKMLRQLFFGSSENDNQIN